MKRVRIKEKKIDATLDGVSSAIRRYKLDHYDEIFTMANKIVSLGEISTRGKLANIAVIKDAEIQQILPQLFSIIHYNRGDVLRIIQADEAIKILVNEMTKTEFASCMDDNSSNFAWQRQRPPL